MNQYVAECGADATCHRAINSGERYVVQKAEKGPKVVSELWGWLCYAKDAKHAKHRRDISALV